MFKEMLSTDCRVTAFAANEAVIEGTPPVATRLLLNVIVLAEIFTTPLRFPTRVGFVLLVLVMIVVCCLMVVNSCFVTCDDSCSGGCLLLVQ